MPRLLPAQPVPRLNRVSPSDMAVHRVDAACQTVVRGNLPGGAPVPWSGWHRWPRRRWWCLVPASKGWGSWPRSEGAARVAQCPAIVGACARHHLGGVGVDPVAQGVAGDERTHRHPSTVTDAVPTPPFPHGMLDAKTLPTRAPPRPHCLRPGRRQTLLRTRHSPLPHRGECACRPPAGQTAPPRARWQAQRPRPPSGHTALFQPAHRPWRLPAPGAAAGEHDGVHRSTRLEGAAGRFRACRERRRARPPGHSALARHDDGAARGPGGFR